MACLRKNGRPTSILKNIFDRIHTSIHGIDETAVIGAPTFPIVGANLVEMDRRVSLFVSIPGSGMAQPSAPAPLGDTPDLGAVGSAWLLYDVVEDEKKRRVLCLQASVSDRARRWWSRQQRRMLGEMR